MSTKIKQNGNNQKQQRRAHQTSRGTFDDGKAWSSSAEFEFGVCVVENCRLHVKVRVCRHPTRQKGAQHRLQRSQKIGLEGVGPEL